MRQHVANVVLVSLLFVLTARALAAGSPEPVAGNEEVVEAVPEELPEAAQPGSELADDGEVFDEIVITGQRTSVMRKLMNDFIIEIGEPAASSRGYARWRHPLCTGVYNLPDQTTAQYVADKLTIAALELGLKTGTPGCSPNLHIVFSPDARELATYLVETSPDMFRPWGGAGGTTPGLAALEKFKTSEAPVRWWQITMVVDEWGAPAITLPGCQVDVMGTCGTTLIRGTASRLKAPTYDEIWASLIIVDVSKLGAVKWPQLTDYLAMVGLAQIDPEGRPVGYDSILNLFVADNPPRVMSEMDRTYLQSLYTIDLMTFPHTQRGILSNRMIRTLREISD